MVGGSTGRILHRIYLYHLQNIPTVERLQQAIDRFNNFPPLLAVRSYDIIERKARGTVETTYILQSSSLLKEYRLPAYLLPRMYYHSVFSWDDTPLMKSSKHIPGTKYVPVVRSWANMQATTDDLITVVFEQ